MANRSQSKSGFTLVELLAVVVIIAALAAVALQMASYLNRQNLTTLTRAQIAAIESSLENYRTDFGYYPGTTPVLLSSLYLGEATNNWLLYRALFDKGKRYLVSFPKDQIRLNAGTCPPGTSGCAALTNIFDVYGLPFNFYNSPGTAYGISNNVQTNFNINCGYTVGGQANPLLYDLFSYGVDRVTFADTNAAAQDTSGTVPWNRIGWKQTSAALDDITNWGRR